MKLKFGFKQKMIILCCVPMVLLTVISIMLGLEQFKNGMYKETKSSLYSNVIAAQNLYSNKGYGDYVMKSDGAVWRGMNFNVSSETSVVDSLKEKTGVDITFFYQDTAVMTSIKNDDDQRWIGMTAGDNIKKYTLEKGAELWYKNIEIDGQLCHAYIIPITQSSDGSVVGAMMASQPVNGMESIINRYVTISVVVSFAIMIVVAVVILLYIGNLTKVLHDVRRVLLKVSTGDLSDERLINIKRSDEFGELAQGTEKLRFKIEELLSETSRGTTKLKDAVERLNTTSERVIDAADKTGSNIEKINMSANSQKKETKGAESNVKKTNEAINLMINQIDDINALSNDMAEYSKESQNILEQLLNRSRNSQSTVKEISRQVNDTNESVQSIKSVTEYITDIASETSLLALNASIEAARAGEAGKGFAVVAEQIQKLAEQSNNSAEEIGKSIGSLVEKTEGIVNAMTTIQSTLEEQEKSVDNTKEIFDKLNASITSVNDKEKEMQSNVAEMNQAKEEMSYSIKEISNAAVDSAAISENAESITREMTNEINGLTTLMADLTDVANKLNDNLEMFLK